MNSLFRSSFFCLFWLPENCDCCLGTHKCTVSTSRTVIFNQFNEAVAFVIEMWGETKSILRAWYNAKLTAFANHAINFYCSFNHFLSFQNEVGFNFNIFLTTYMPSEPLVLKGFWAKNKALIVSFKKIRDWRIPNFEKQIYYIGNY